MIFDELSKIAEYLKHESDCVLLERLKQLDESNIFYLTFWGHFSAGKSRLINTLLDRVVLPVKNTETTAYLTYLQYGKDECCNIVYENGVVEQLDLLKSTEIFQDSKSIQNAEKIDHIEIYLDSDLLKSGITIVDTPGMNTIIQKHLDIAINSINQAGKIYYVLGKPVSDKDREFIKKINNSGINISFIRTQCDLINSEEENVEQTLANEKDRVCKLIGKDIEFTPVSCDKKSSFFVNVENVRQMLMQTAEHLDDEMKESIHGRSIVFIERYIAELEERKKYLNQVVDGNAKEVEDKIAKCQVELDTIKRISEASVSKIESKIENVKEDCKNEVEGLKRNIKKKYANKIETVESADESKMDSILKESMESFISNAHEVFNRQFSSIIKGEQCELDENLGSFDIDYSIPSYEEVQLENTQTIDMFRNRLIELKDSLEKIKELRQKNANELAAADDFNEHEYETAIAELDKSLMEIPNTPALRECADQPIQPSAIFKKIGDAADIALLLLPGSAIANGAKWVAKSTKIGKTVAQVLHKSTKVMKALSAVDNHINAIDKVRDFSYTAQKIFQGRNYSTKSERALADKLVNTGIEKLGETYDKFREKKQSGNVLDALSVSYWMQKIGSVFDSGPKMELDREVEAERESQRQQIYEQQQKLSKERLRKKTELGLLRDESVRLKYEEEEKTLTAKKYMEELQRQEAGMKKIAFDKALQKYKSNNIAHMEKCMDSLSSQLVESYFKSAAQNITLYVSRKNKECMDKLEEKKTQFENLLQLRNNGSDQVKNEIALCDDYLSKIRES